MAVGEVSEYGELFRLKERLWSDDNKNRCLFSYQFLEDAEFIANKNSHFQLSIR